MSAFDSAHSVRTNACATTMSPTHAGPTIKIFMVRRSPQRTLREIGDRGMPLRVHVALAAHLIEIERLQFRRDRTASARADRTAVEFANRQHFGRGTGEEGFIGDIDLV